MEILEKREINKEGETMLNFLKWLKEEKDDPHTKFIIPDDLSGAELEIFDKFQNKNLTLEELQTAQNDYANDFFQKLEKEGKNKDEIFKEAFTDSKMSFYAMLVNKLLSDLAFKKLQEKKNNREK